MNPSPSPLIPQSTRLTQGSHDWPIAARPYDPQPALRRHDRAVLVGMAVVIASAMILIALVVLLGTSVPEAIYVILGIVLFTAVVVTLEDVYEDLRQRRLPAEPGLMITGAMIGRAYAGLPLRRLALSTPIITHDPFNTDGFDYFTHYRVCTNDVFVLRFAPTMRIHRYVLY